MSVLPSLEHGSQKLDTASLAEFTCAAHLIEGDRLLDIKERI